MILCSASEPVALLRWPGLTRRGTWKLAPVRFVSKRIFTLQSKGNGHCREVSSEEESTADYADFTDGKTIVPISFPLIHVIRVTRGFTRNSFLCGPLCPLCEPLKFVDCQR